MSFQNIFSYDRRKYENIFDDPESRSGIIFNHIINLFIIFSVVIIVLETINPIDIIYKEELFYCNFLISSIFLIDYLYRFLRARKKRTFISSGFNFIDLMSFLPFFLWMIFSIFRYWDTLKILRIMRVFRVLRLVRNIPITIWFVKALKIYWDEYKAVFMLFSIIIFVVSVFVYEIENPVNPQFSSVWISLWWGVVTAATVWYGDIVPITPMWKIIWSIVILLGPVLLSVIWAITILVFTDVANTQDKLKKGKTKICIYCEKDNVIDANYCVNCWRKFKLQKKENGFD